jgi:hypothetical protein
VSIRIDQQEADMSKIQLKRPLLIGISWFFIAFLSSELSFRAANAIYDYNDFLADKLYQFSGSIAWPANDLYNIRYKQILESSIDQSNEDNASLDFFGLDDEIDNLTDEELWDLSETLSSGGYKASLSAVDEYVVYISACAFTGTLLAFLSGLINSLFFNQTKQEGTQMNIQDAVKVKNKVKIKSLLSATLIHLTLAIMTVGISLILLLITGLVTSALLKKEISQASSGSNTFKKNFPFQSYGEVVGNFQHVFSHEQILDKNLYNAIETELTTKTPIDKLSSITITDVDTDLEATEGRTFIKAESGQTKRGTSITLILYQSNFGKMQSIQWRVLAGGFIDSNKKFNWIAYSLFSLSFWIIPYLKKEFDLLSRVRTIYPGAYNDIDVMTQVRCIHEAVFDAMINELEANDIDTSDLKAQKMQTMNINISGGKVSMGNVVQGAMNKVSNRAKGNKS